MGDSTGKPVTEPKVRGLVEPEIKIPSQECARGDDEFIETRIQSALIKIKATVA